MDDHARGPFDVTLTPEGGSSGSGELPMTRLLLDKRFRGDLEATSRGEMLAVNTEDMSSGGYVAMEWVTGTLAGRSGSFALQHSGIMTDGEGQLSVTVVPGSATGDLAGLAGRMEIEIRDGAHVYDFSYTLPDPDAP